MAHQLIPDRVILYIDDDPIWVANWLVEAGARVPADVLLLAASTKHEAREAFWRYRLCMVILDGELPGMELNTLDLIAEFRGAGYDGLLVACSPFSGHCRQMEDAGCNYSCSKSGLRDLTIWAAAQPEPFRLQPTG